MLSYQDMELVPLYTGDAPASQSDGLRLANATGDFAVFTPGGRKVQILMAGAVVTVDCGGDDAKAEAKFDLRPAAGSDTDRGDGDVGHLKFADTAGGKVIYDDSAVNQVIEPGAEVVFEITQIAAGANAAGQARPFLLVRPVPEEPVNLDNMVKTE